MRPLPPQVRLPRPRRRVRAPWAWLWQAWLLPTDLLGHIAGIALGGRGPGRVTGPAASAWLYQIRPGLGFDWVGAVTLGHVVLHRRGSFDGSVGRLILAHELAHTRQHDVLGPLFLPLHMVAQIASAVLSVGQPPHHSRVHDHNPLEQSFICLGASGYEALAAGGVYTNSAGQSIDAGAMLRAFGLEEPA